MKQVVLPPDYDGGSSSTARGALRHYLADVRRLSAGDELDGITADGWPVRLRIEWVDAGSCALSVRAVPETGAASSGSVSLVRGFSFCILCSVFLFSGAILNKTGELYHIRLSQ